MILSVKRIKEALRMARGEWEALLERFFNLGGKLKEEP
jgi:hypothetical protein